jgi:hypothetical protein
MVPLVLQSAIETELAALITELALKQPAYFAAKGRYWQGARTHAVPPSDGLLAAPNIKVKPTDETDTWETLGIVLPALTSAAYTVHAYQTRAGHGYVIHADVIISGVHHRKSVNVGPATWLTQTWFTCKIIPMS